MRLTLQTALLVAWAVLFTAAGLHTELEFIARKPLPNSLLQDFNFYRDALHALTDGNDPYSDRGIGTGFLYPPPALFLIALLEPFDSLWRASLITSLSLAGLGVMLAGVALCYGLRPSQVWWWFPLGFAFAPVLETLHLGQVNLLVAFGVFVMFAFAVRRPVLAGVGLAAAICLKVTPILFFIYLIVARRFLALVVAIATIAGFGTAFGIVFGFEHAVTYIDVFRDLSQKNLAGNGNAQSISAILVYHGAIEASTQTLVQRVIDSCLALAIVAVSLLTYSRGRSDGLFVVIGLSLVPLANISWYHHYAFLLLPLCVWMASLKLHPFVVVWVLAGMTAIQFDRSGLTHGLLAQFFILATVGLVLIAELVPPDRWALGAPRGASTNGT